MLLLKNLKLKKQVKNALLDLFALKKAGSFWFKDKTGILSIRINASRGKVFLNIRLPKKFKTTRPAQMNCGFRQDFDATEQYDTIISKPSIEELELLKAKKQRLYYCPDVDGHINAALLLGWINVFPDGILTKTAESKPKYVLLKSEYGCAFIYVSRKKDK